MSKPFLPVTTLWSERFDRWPGREELARLERLGFVFPTIEDPNEWIVGSLILDERLRSMAVVYASRGDAGIDFELRAACSRPPRADEIRSAILEIFAHADRSGELVDDIERLWSLSDDELLAELGVCLMPGSREFSGGEREARRRARNWFALNREDIGELLRENGDLANNRRDAARLARLLADLVTGVAAVSASIYLVRHELSVPGDDGDQL